jgi:dephospho-CoA kinase
MLNGKKVIGLTGLYCAGKNHAALILQRHGLPVLDVDKLGHLVIEKEKERIIARFGAEITDGGAGGIDRKKLGAKVFGKPLELAALEDIVHPAVNRETADWIGAQKENACVINAALLHRSSASTVMDAVIIVEAPYITRLLRAKKRDRLPWLALIKRFGSQNNFNTQYFQGKTDIYRVDNRGYSGFGRTFFQNRLEKRVEEILSLLGIT